MVQQLYTAVCLPRLPVTAPLQCFPERYDLKVIMENEIDFELILHVEEQNNISLFYFIKTRFIYLYPLSLSSSYTGCFTTLGHNCRR